MGLFGGGDNEEKKQRFQEMESRLDSLESHLEAVDSALQDFTDNYSRILEEELDYQEQELDALRQQIDERGDSEVEERVSRLEERLSSLERSFEELVGEDLSRSISEVVDEIRDVRRFMQSTKDRVSEVEEKVEDVESELMIEINNRDFDFEKKLDERRFEEETGSIREELNKLKASVSYLADELDSSDEIEIE